MQETVGAEIPLRAKGLNTLRKMLARRSPTALQAFPRLLRLFEIQLRHDDSFVYQAALNALAAAADVEPDTVLPRLAQLLLPTDKDTLPAGAALPPVCEVTSGARLAPADFPLRDVEVRRLKASQAICGAVLRLGETLPPHADAAMHALLVGARDYQPAVRASCLACLAQVSADAKLEYSTIAR